MQVKFYDLPARFVEVHRRQLSNWLHVWPIARTWTINLREPLDTVEEDAFDEDMPYPTLRVSIEYNGVLTIRPDDMQSQALIHEWSKRHERTTMDEFDWLPTGNEDKAGA